MFCEYNHLDTQVNSKIYAAFLIINSKLILDNILISIKLYILYCLEFNLEKVSIKD